jgi:thiol-disulfide isomerase/thioredoxin
MYLEEVFMKLLLWLLLLLPLVAVAQEKSDDHNSLPLGFLNRSDILNGVKIYNFNYVEYVPKSESVQLIHNYPGQAEIKVVFGDWCKDSKKHVPAFIKTMEFADNRNIHVVFINLDRQKKEPADLISELDVHNVPTFIVSSDGQELGRIVETPKTRIEEDLAQILTGEPGSK